MRADAIIARTLAPLTTHKGCHIAGISAGRVGDVPAAMASRSEVGVKRWPAWSLQRFAFDKWITCRLVS